MHTLIAAAAGWLVGCFTPAVCKEVKSWFSSEAKTVVADVVKKL